MHSEDERYLPDSSHCCYYSSTVDRGDMGFAEPLINNDSDYDNFIKFELDNLQFSLLFQQLFHIDNLQFSLLFQQLFHIDNFIHQ
jgi:hypothetical protein